jgi:hypothetical protein
MCAPFPPSLPPSPPAPAAGQDPTGEDLVDCVPTRPLAEGEDDLNDRRYQGIMAVRMANTRARVARVARVGHGEGVSFDEGILHFAWSLSSLGTVIHQSVRCPSWWLTGSQTLPLPPPTSRSSASELRMCESVTTARTLSLSFSLSLSLSPLARSPLPSSTPLWLAHLWPLPSGLFRDLPPLSLCLCLSYSLILLSASRCGLGRKDGKCLLTESYQV